MPSHFSCLGHPVEDEAGFSALAARVADEGDALPTRSGTYHRWIPSPGVELWAQSQGDELVGLNPHFAGPARMPVGVTAHVDVPGAGPLDATLHAWAAPEDPADPESGAFPFVFDVPDLALEALPALPVSARAQVTVFAHAFAWYADEEAFAAAQEDVPFAAESFIPTGLFADEGPPEPEALAHGVLLDGALQRNATTRHPFWSGRIRTLGGELDVVADADQVGEAPAAGAIIAVGGWLSGRLHETRSVAPPRKALAGRLFGSRRR